MGWWKFGAAALAWALLGAPAQAGELQLRNAVKNEIRQAFARGDFAAIEARYAAALAKDERTPSGVSIANVIRDAMVPGAPAELTTPGKDAHWKPVEARIEAWVAQFPQSALPAIAQSKAFLGHGWSWRGRGASATVTSEGWRQFHAYGQRAYESLMAREKAGRRDPLWYDQMLDVALAQSWPAAQYDALAEAAVSAFPYSYDIWFSISWRLLPRWGGSHEAIAELARLGVERTRDREGESMYARIYWNVNSVLDTELWGPEVDWKRVRAGFDDIVQRYPDSWNLNHYARMACAARDFETARRVLDRIGDEVDQAAWRDRATYLGCRRAAGVIAEAAK